MTLNTPIFEQSSDDLFMAEALKEAKKAALINEVPIGAIVVYENKIIARAHNTREQDANPSAHAEFKAMIEASRKLNRWRLSGCTVYVTLEPCTMCAGLLLNSRVDRCVFGASDPKGGALGTVLDVSDVPAFNHSLNVRGGVCDDECAALLSEFFQSLRERRKK